LHQARPNQIVGRRGQVAKDRFIGMHQQLGGQKSANKSLVGRHTGSAGLLVAHHINPLAVRRVALRPRKL